SFSMHICTSLYFDLCRIFDFSFRFLSGCITHQILFLISYLNATPCHLNSHCHCSTVCCVFPVAHSSALIRVFHALYLCLMLEQCYLSSSSLIRLQQALK